MPVPMVSTRTVPVVLAAGAKPLFCDGRRVGIIEGTTVRPSTPPNSSTAEMPIHALSMLAAVMHLAVLDDAGHSAADGQVGRQRRIGRDRRRPPA